MDTNISIILGDDGVLLARIDMPGRAVNVFSLDMMDSLERLLDHVDATAAVQAVVITSGKNSFLAGADLEMVSMFTREARTASHEALHDLCGRLGRLFCRLEKSRKPYVAAVNGLALGGGLELALACHGRVVADVRSVQLGLPEIKLGLLPGAGGTQRLSRLIDPLVAMQMLLGGDPVSPARALDLGMIDQVVAPEQLIDAARERARSLDNPRAPWDVPGRVFSSAPFDFTSPDVFGQIRSICGISDYQFAKYPAYEAIMKCVVGGWGKPIDAASHWEMDCFIHLIRSPVAGNMVRTLFLNLQRAAKEGAASKALADARVAVLGRPPAAIATMLQAGKVPLIDAAELTDGDIAVQVGGATAQGGHGIEWLSDDGGAAIPLAGSVGLWLADAGEHGRCAEVVVRKGQEVQADVGRKLAQWLRATVFVSIATGKVPFVASLLAVRKTAEQAGCSEDDVLLAVALAAGRGWADGAVSDLALADVAAVLAGAHPSYTGGPFSYLRNAGAVALRDRVAKAASSWKALFAIPERFEALMGELVRE